MITLVPKEFHEKMMCGMVFNTKKNAGCKKIPYFSTFGKNYIRHFKDSDPFEQISKRIQKEIEKD